jgi:hypothetical protein
MKTKKRTRDSGWTQEEQEARAPTLRTASAVRSHDTKEKRSALKLKLQRSRLEREVSTLKQRLECWDSVQEKEIREAAIAAAAKPVSSDEPKKKKGRLGPETWKLKGAARPANQVYDFDVRYVNPHVKAHEEARQKAKRSVNLLLVNNHQGDFLNQAGEVGREYLSTLMQLAHLSHEMNHFKTARACFLECIELDSSTITTAREDLMRMYMKLNRAEAALRLGQRLEDDDSVWIRYSHALVSYQAKEDQPEHQMARAIKSNPFCAYYLAFHETFSNVMEYTDDLQEADDVPQTSLEEAIDYCVSEASKQWTESGAAMDMRNMLLQAAQGKHKLLASSDIEWSQRLEKIVATYEADLSFDEDHTAETELGESRGLSADTDQEVEQRSTKLSADLEAGKDKPAEEETDDEEEDDNEEETDEEGVETVDVKMYAGMFRTAMEMLQSAGHWK